METRGRKSSTYAIYKGDVFMCIGTQQECAEYLGITIGSLQSMLSKSKDWEYNRKLIAVKLDEEDEEVC